METKESGKLIRNSKALMDALDFKRDPDDVLSAKVRTYKKNLNEGELLIEIHDKSKYEGFNREEFKVGVSIGPGWEALVNLIELLDEHALNSLPEYKDPYSKVIGFLKSEMQEYGYQRLLAILSGVVTRENINNWIEDINSLRTREHRFYHDLVLPRIQNKFPEFSIINDRHQEERIIYLIDPKVVKDKNRVIKLSHVGYAIVVGKAKVVEVDGQVQVIDDTFGQERTPSTFEVWLGRDLEHIIANPDIIDEALEKLDENLPLKFR